MATSLPAETGCYFSLERPGDTLKSEVKGPLIPWALLGEVEE